MSGPKTLEKKKAAAVHQSQIVNLSAKILSEPKISVLSLGLSFSPTYNFDLIQTVVDVNRFVRQLTIKKHFWDLPQITNIDGEDELLASISSDYPLI